MRVGVVLIELVAGDQAFSHKIQDFENGTLAQTGGWLSGWLSGWLMAWLMADERVGGQRGMKSELHELKRLLLTFRPDDVVDGDEKRDNC